MQGLKGSAVIVGAYEHPGRMLPDHTLPRLHREVAMGALADAGLSLSDVDGFFTDATIPGLGPLDMMEYLGLSSTYTATSDFGGSTYVAYVGQAAAAIAAGHCRVALISLAGLPNQAATRNAALVAARGPIAPFEDSGSLGGYGPVGDYALVARRHMHDHGTTSEQLAWIKVAAAHHAQFNPHARLKGNVTVDDVLASPFIADPLHLMDCCVITDGGGALVVVHPDVARDLGRRGATLLGYGEAHKDSLAGDVDLSYTANRRAGELAYAEAGVGPRQIQYASLYDSFTITVLMALEDLGFCAPGEGGRYVEDLGLTAKDGRMPVNTDGGGLMNNHPGNRGGMTKVIEAVRQLRGEAHPEVQVPDCRIALAAGTGFRLSQRHYRSCVILEAFACPPT
jgi:acetyl-CoA C-acetyltransferase